MAATPSIEVPIAFLRPATLIFGKRKIGERRKKNLGRPVKNGGIHEAEKVNFYWFQTICHEKATEHSRRGYRSWWRRVPPSVNLR